MKQSVIFFANSAQKYKKNSTPFVGRISFLFEKFVI